MRSTNARPAAGVNRWFNATALIVLLSVGGWFAWHGASRWHRARTETAALAARANAAEAERENLRSRSIKRHVPQKLEIEEGMGVQGPIVVGTGVDGNEDVNGAWTNPANASSPSGASVAVGQAGLSATLKTNTLKCQFSAAAFSITGSASQISVSFQALVSGGMGSPVVRVKSVKTNVTGATDQADMASLTLTDTLYTYTFTGLSIAAATINGAWEIDLVFDSDNSNDFGNANVYHVKATVTYGIIDIYPIPVLDYFALTQDGGGSGVAWTNPANAENAPNSAYATATVTNPGGSSSDLLEFSQWLGGGAQSQPIRRSWA